LPRGLVLSASNLKAAPGGVTSTAERLTTANYEEKAIMFDTSDQLEGGPTAQTLPLTATPLNDALSRELLELASRLRLILPVIGVSVMALRREDAEADADIASVLSESAWLPLDSEIERVESILEAHAWRHLQQEAHA
jgi:hypothetical protein